MISPKHLTPYTEKMEQILLASGLSKETVTAIMILNKNTKVKVRSLDGRTDFFDTVAGVLQGDTLAPISVHNLLSQRTSNVYRSNERKWFYTKNKEADDTPHKLLRTQMTSRFWQIHLPKPNPCCIRWIRLPVGLVSMWMQTRRSACVLIKKETSPH